MRELRRDERVQLGPDPMRVFVFGAGASIHAGYPPTARLGQELLKWSDLDQKEGPNYRADLHSLRSEYGDLSDLERILTELRSDLREERRKRILDSVGAISWFFNSIRDNTAALYDQFARRHVEPGDAIITFNYDLALERSLRSARLWEIFDGYGAAMAFPKEGVEPSPVKIFKLHGSTNWWGPLFGGSQGFGAARDSVGGRPVIFFTADFEYLGYTDGRDPNAPNNSGLVKTGSMIPPEQHKQFFMETSFGRERESFWNGLWSEAEDALKRAEEIVIIGYSRPLADERARKLLLEHTGRSARVVVCSQSRSEDIAAEFGRRGFDNVTVPHNPTFEGFLDNDRQIQMSVIPSTDPQTAQPTSPLL